MKRVRVSRGSGTVITPDAECIRMESNIKCLESAYR